jgi:hypothetical protein
MWMKGSSPKRFKSLTAISRLAEVVTATFTPDFRNRLMTCTDRTPTHISGG